MNRFFGVTALVTALAFSGCHAMGGKCGESKCSQRAESECPYMKEHGEKCAKDATKSSCGEKCCGGDKQASTK